MYTRNKVRFRVIWGFAWPNVLVFTLHAALVTAAYQGLGWKFLGIPFLPISTVGIGVAFYLGFKNNGSYDRLWEARTIWGSLINNNRTFCNQCLNFLTTDVQESEVKEIMFRHLAFVNALRLHLRRQTDWEQIREWLPATEFEQVIYAQNVPNKILQLQHRHLERLQREEGIELFRYLDMYNTVKEFTSDQGRCERIKNTPFPRQYAYITTLFTWIFILLLPLGLLSEFAKLGEGLVWATVPFSVLVSWIVITMDLVGHYSENPFENQINDVPMTALCRTMEIDLKEMIGMQELPERIQPIKDILL
jgi:putative membrane protein